MNAGATTCRGVAEHRAPPVERELRRDDLGLVLERRSRAPACESKVSAPVRITATIASPSVVGAVGGVDHPRAEAVDLTLEDGAHQGLLAGEAPVDGGPGAAGLLATSSRVVLATPTRATHASAASSTRSAIGPADG